MNGDEKDKIVMSFRLIDDKNKGYFVKEDLAMMIKSIVNSWAAITQTTLTKEMLNKVDKQINHIFKVMDIKKENKVDEQDFIVSLQKYPDLLEIFDFLNKGVTDTVVHNDFRSRELQIARELSHIEKFLDSLNSYLVGEGYQLLEINLINQDQIHQKIDFNNKDCYNRAPSFQEIQKKLHPFGGNNGINEEKYNVEDSIPLNIEKGIDVSHQLLTLNNLQLQNLKQSTATLVQKPEQNKNKITHSLSVDLRNKQHENMQYLQTEQDQQNPQHSNYRSNASEYGSVDRKQFEDTDSKNFEKIEVEDKFHKGNDLKIETINTSNQQQLLQLPNTSLQNTHTKSQDSYVSQQNATFQPNGKNGSSPTNTNLATPITPKQNSQLNSQLRQQTSNIPRSNSLVNNDQNKQFNIFQSPSTGIGMGEFQFNRNSLMSQHKRNFSSQSNSNDAETAQFVTSINQQQFWLQSLQQSKQPDYIMEGSCMSNNVMLNKGNIMNTPFNNMTNQQNNPYIKQNSANGFTNPAKQPLNNSISSGQDFKKVGVSFQVPLKGFQENENPAEKRRSSILSQNNEKSNKQLTMSKAPLQYSSLISPIPNTATNGQQVQPISPKISSLHFLEEELILKKYENIMCGDCIQKVTHKFKSDQFKEQKRLSSIIQQQQQNSSQKKNLNISSQQPSLYSQIPRQQQNSSGLMPQSIKETNFYLDSTNHNMRTKLSRIAQKFLGDLDEIESCCIGSDDEEYRKKPQSNVTSPPPPIQPMGFQYFDPITINPKKGDSGLYVSGISIKDQKPPLSGQPNKYHQNFKQQFSSSSNTNFNDAIAADSQIKAGKDYVNEDFTNRIIKFDDTDYSRMNSPNQMVSPHASNLVSFYEQRSEIGGAGGTSGIGGGQKKSTLYSQQGTANFSKQSINAAYNTSRLTNIQGYQLKYPNSNMRQFGKSSTVEYIRQTSASIGNAIENAHHYQHSKTLSNQAINIPNPDDAVALITDDIEIEISANAQRVGNKFIHSELNIKEMNPPSKNLIDLNQNSNFQKQTTFNAINNDYTIPIDPTNQPYVDMYNTNSKNLQSTEKVRISSLASQVPSVSLSNNSNRRIINVANLKNQKDFESQPSDAQHQTPTALLNKLEAEQIISSVSHDLNKLQFGGKLLQDKQTVSQQAGYGYGYGGQMRDNSQTQGIKASNKYNLEATGVVNQYIEEQEQQFSSNENLLQEPLPHPKIALQHEKKKKLFSDKESDLIFEEDQHYKRNRNNGKLSQMLSQSSSNERISQYMHIQQVERNQTNSPTYKGSNYYTNNYQESQYNDLQNGQMNREDIVGEFQGQAFMKPPQHNIYSATKNGMNPLMMKSQAIPYNSNRNTYMQEQFKVQSTILSPSKLNGRTQTHGNPNNLLEQEESHQINFIQYIMEMNADELKKRVLQIISYVKEIQNYVLTIRRSIETNLNARLSEKQGSNIYNQSRKRSQETKNQSFNKMQQQQDKSPLNNKQAPLANQSAQGRFPQINQSHQLNQSGIINNRTPPLQANPNTNNIEEETIRISTISNIQKKLPKQKEQRKPKLMVFFGHQNWNLVVNMMMGIQMSVQSAASNVILNENNTMPDLQSRDFKVKYLFELLPRKDNFEKEWSYKVCKFQDYAPNVFQRIRMFYNITDEQYLKSLGPNQLFNLGNGGLNSFSQLTSTGKSGSFFYYTADGQFTLKTVSRAEFHHLKFILRNYYEHVKDNRNSLIIKFFGLHKIKIRMKKSTKVEIVYIVIMGNVFHTTKLINERYDLKGSTYGRSTKIKILSLIKNCKSIIGLQDFLIKYLVPENMRTKNHYFSLLFLFQICSINFEFIRASNNIILTLTTKNRTQGVTMKDLDFLENKTKIQAKYDEYEEFMSVVRKDAKFFEENNIIDYSMLVGIHYNFNQNQEQSDQVSYTIREQLSRVQQYRDFRQTRDISSFSSRDQKLYYLFGIIDILTCFNAKKKFEYVAKRIAFGPTISAIPPSQYSSRFVKFMDEMFDDDSKVPPELKQ